MKATHITVRTREGTALFRRAGFAFTREPKEIALADLTPEQLEAIRGERELEVSEEAPPQQQAPRVPPPAAEPEEPESRRRSPKR